MKDSPAVAASPKDDTKNPDDWQVKNWAETVMDGEKIKADPKKMKHVRKHLKGHQKAIGKIMSTNDLRKKAQEMEGSAEEESSESPDMESTEKKKGID